MQRIQYQSGKKYFTWLGLHINLTQGSPIPNNVKSLVDENNIFHNHKKIENSEIEIIYEDAYNEIKTQIEKLLSYNVKTDHLDNHHFIHRNPSIRKALIDLALEYKLPIRTMNDDFREEVKKLGLKTPDAFCFDFYNDSAQWESIVNFINNHNHCDSIEVLTYCGYIDN